MSPNNKGLGAPESFSYHFPINVVSFGQVSIALLREIKSRVPDSLIKLFPISSTDLSSQAENPDFSKWIKDSLEFAPDNHNRSNPLIRLWHLYDVERTLSSFSFDQRLITFHELDELTKREINIANNLDKIYLTSEYSVDVFREHGIKHAHYLPLGFDHHNHFRTDKKYFDDDRITFNLVGKFEKRKNHKEVIQAWLKRFGNDNRYFLQCSIHNTFLKPEENSQIFASILGGQRFSNIQFLTFMDTNAKYNDFLNSGDIVIGGSGGEGWGLPEFHSVGLGKHAVITDGTGYKSWATDENSCLIKPGKKEEIYDNVFFHKGAPYNQGRYHTLDADSFIDGCERAIERCRKNRINENGLKIQKDFLYSKTLDTLISEDQPSVDLTKLKIEASSPYNDGWTQEHYRKEIEKHAEEEKS
tara:strand:+ start:559 stop:1803 length:1245 start_codon:yes stop_codon:yes gene_type:complete